MSTAPVSDDRCDELEVAAPQAEPWHRMIGGRRYVFAAPGGDPRTIVIDDKAGRFVGVPGPGAFPDSGHIRVETLALEDAIHQAEAGDVVQLLPGKYWPPLEKRRDRGRPIRFQSGGRADAPIVVRGLGARTVLAGSNAATPLYPRLPTMGDFAFFQVSGHSHIAFEDLHAESCWPCFVYAEDAAGIAVRRCRVVDGVYVLFASGASCRDMTVEDSQWVQDPTGALWDAVDFDDSHGDVIDGERVGRYRFYNGAMFGSLDIPGGVVFRRNHVRDAYNGLRMDTTSRADGGAPERCNVNVQIHDNLFERLRDNVVEPEGHALNWHIRHNRIRDCHGWFSWDGVAGGLVLIFGNVGWFTARPGQFWDSNSGGKVFKSIRSDEYDAAAADTLLPSQPIHMFNNSWFLRIFVVKKSELRHFHHYNNALVYCYGCRYEACTCKSDRQLFTKLLDKRGWRGDVTFDHDATSRPDFGKEPKKARQEKDGKTDAQFGFDDPAAGAFGFDGEGVPGRRVVLERGKDLAGPDSWSYPPDDGVVWCGAYQGRTLIPAPPFVPVPLPAASGSD